jgi:hypothetical protein
MKTSQKEIKRIVEEYATHLSPQEEDLLKAELQRLVLLAQREQMQIDYDNTMRILSKGGGEK